jgi:hypothetical protein
MRSRASLLLCACDSSSLKSSQWWALGACRMHMQTAKSAAIKDFNQMHARLGLDFVQCIRLKLVSFETFVWNVSLHNICYTLYVGDLHIALIFTSGVLEWTFFTRLYFKVKFENNFIFQCTELYLHLVRTLAQLLFFRERCKTIEMIIESVCCLALSAASKACQQLVKHVSS